MWSSGPNYTKLKTNLKLAQNRLKLLEKKKTEIAQKSRKEIADYIATGKVERARIRVEHIIREDFLVEAMEIVEMFCDLLLARFGLITQMKELDEGISEAVASLIWVTPRLQADVQELKTVSDVFAVKYGKPLIQAIVDGQGDLKPSDKLVHKLAIQAPPKLLVEKYLIEIAKVYNIEYEPDPQVMSQRDGVLIDLSGGPGGSIPPAPGFMGYPQPPMFPSMPSMPSPPASTPFNYPPPGGPSGGGGGGGFGAASLPTAPEVSARHYPRLYGEKPKPKSVDDGTSDEMSDAVAKFLAEENGDVAPPPSYDSLPSDSVPAMFKPTPTPRTQHSDPIQDLPAIPTDLPDVPQDPAEPTQSDDIDFDDLSRRFEALKKKK